MKKIENKLFNAMLVLTGILVITIILVAIFGNNQIAHPVYWIVR